MKKKTRERKNKGRKGKDGERIRRLESWQEISLMPGTNLLGRGPSDSQIPGQKEGTDQLQMLLPLLRRGVGQLKGPGASSRAKSQLTFQA